MKKSIKQIIAVILSLAMIITTLFITPIISDAATVDGMESTLLKIWADPSGVITQEDMDNYNAGDKTSMVGAISPHKVSSSGNNYLFLPSTADCTNLVFWFSGTMTIDNKEVVCGEPTDALSNINAGGVSASHTFKLNSTSYTITCMKSGDVGTVYIDTESGSLKSINASSDHSAFESGTVMVVAPDGTVEYDGVMEKMQGRGNATWDLDKRPYNVKLAVSTSLLGMNKAKKWVLLANALDPTLLRDQIGYDYSKYIGVKYQPICKPVDVYCNQMYIGSYQLSEKVELKSNRIDVNDAYENLEIANGSVDPATGLITPADFDTNAPTTKIYKSSGAVETSTTKATQCATVGNRKYSTGINSPDDVTGGYLYELEISERWIDENAGFCAYNRQGWVVKSADYATKDMVDYSYDLLYALGSAVYNNGVVPSTTTTPSAPSSISHPAPAAQYQGKKWSDLLDAESAVKYFWIQEYFKNLDSSTSSTYFYKDSDSIDSKLYAGPVWDLDHSMETVIVDTGLSLADRMMNGRWGNKWSSATGWYARNVRIYMWDGKSTSTSGTSDSSSPRSFYGALYYNNSDFQKMFNKFWYTTMTKANNVLLGEEVDPTGTLKSLDDYFATVKKTALMNNARFSYTSSSKSYFNESTLKSGLKTWFTNRNNWINQQITQADISKVSVSSIPNQTCTGSPIEPKLTLKDGDVELVEGEDYTVEYSNNVEASSTANIKITGIGYYKGTKNIAFTINAGQLDSAEIYESAYIGDTLTVNAKTTTGDEVNSFVTYQWKADGVDIAGATDNTYEIKPEDAGKNITVVVTGDNSNITGTVTSNACQVATTERPQGFSKLISAWDYDYSLAPEALTTSDETGTTYYYNATSGDHIDGSELRASVNATSTTKMKWSGTADLYANEEGFVTPDQAPIMGTSKTDGLAWGKWGYFETTVSTLGFQSITFSARLGGTKKAPRTWKLQYSLDGVNFKDVENSSYTISANKTMELAFDNVALPDECNNKSKVYIRAVIGEDMAINGINTVVGITSGDAAINNIKIKGETIAVITELAAPTVATNSVAGDGTLAFSTDEVEITDNNGGAKVYYTVNGGEATEYEAGFKVFDKTTAKIGDTATVTAWAEVGLVRSEDTVVDIIFGGVNVNSFSYIDFSKNVSNGAVFSTGGTYGESGRMTAYTDGKSQYVPLWNDGNGAFSIAPDDGALWSAESGFYFEVPTAGYEDIRFTAKMYTTGQGPKSVSLQYSLDKETWTDLDNTVQLGANAELEQAFLTAELPAECNNKARVYIRTATVENSTNLGDKLHKNNSKGNLYINDVVISAEDDGTYKMPYTNKTTAYFGTTPIKYHSPSKMDMQYAVMNPDGELILSGTYPKQIVDENGVVVREEGIDIASAPSFVDKETGAYTVSVWAGDDDDRSIINTAKYYYKGSSVVKFSYTTTKRPIYNYINTEHTELTNTSGTNAGTLSMYPNGTTPATLDYSDVYGVKIAWDAANPFTANKELDKVAGNGYWLAKISTKGYKSLTLNAEQLSSNKGPRDWGIAYSLDGTKYTYLANSNARAISNDSSAVPVETYNNIALPSELDDKDNVYIKIFINGGESVDGAELETLLKGNTGLNNLEICGVALPGEIEYVINTVAFEDASCSAIGKTNVPAFVTVNDQTYYAQDGTITVTLTENERYTATASANSAGTFANTVNITAKAGGTKTIPVVALDVVADGVINAKDYAMISKDSKYATTKDYLKSIFDEFINMAE